MNEALTELLRKSKEAVAAMTPDQRANMYLQQREGWVKAEMKWAKDFRDGKCARD